MKCELKLTNIANRGLCLSDETKMLRRKILNIKVLVYKRQYWNNSTYNVVCKAFFAKKTGYVNRVTEMAAINIPYKK